MTPFSQIEPCQVESTTAASLDQCPQRTADRRRRTCSTSHRSIRAGCVANWSDPARYGAPSSWSSRRVDQRRPGPPPVRCGDGGVRTRHRLSECRPGTPRPALVRPPGTSVALSLLVAPHDVAADRWGWLPLLAGMAVVEGLRRIAPVDVRLKWPNDVMVGERKLCGILAERVDTPDGPACVAGMGINVRLAAELFPVPTATSLLLEAGEQDCPSSSRVVAAVLGAFAPIFSRNGSVPTTTPPSPPRTSAAARPSGAWSGWCSTRTAPSKVSPKQWTPPAGSWSGLLAALRRSAPAT